MNASEFLSGLAALVDDEAGKGTKGLGERVARRTAFEWGGQNLYISIRFQREKALYEEFDGTNYSQLALRHGMAENAVRRIINRERERRKEKQASLLDMPGACAAAPQGKP